MHVTALDVRWLIFCSTLSTQSVGEQQCFNFSLVSHQCPWMYLSRCECRMRTCGTTLISSIGAVSGGAVLHAQKFYLRNVPSIDKVGGPADGLTCIVTGPTRSFHPSLSLHLCFPALHCAHLPTLSLPLCFSAPLESSSACAAWLQWPRARDCRSACAAQSARYGAQVHMPAFDALRPASVCNPLRFSRLPLPHAQTVIKATPCNQ